jgi:predicted lipid-binding transport protein (Tim44 family)
VTYRRPTANDLVPTDEELAAAKTASSAPGTGAAWGGGIGSLLGGAAGLGLSALLTPAGGAGLVAAPELIAGGAGVGGALGSAIGGSIGNKMGQDAGDKLTAEQAKRQKLLDDDAQREEALARLMATR